MSTRLHISNTGNSLFLHYKLFKLSSRTQKMLYFLNDNIFLTNSIQIQPEYLFSRFQNAFMCGKSTQSHIASNTKFLHFVPLCYNIMNRTMKFYNLYNYDFVVQSKLSRVSTKQRKQVSIQNTLVTFAGILLFPQF